MKKSLYLVIKSSPVVFHALEELRELGYNGTVISTESVRQAVEFYPEEHHFFNLRHLADNNLGSSIFCIFILDEERLEEVKKVIRKCTNNFQDIKGFMYSFDVLDYEGTV